MVASRHLKCLKKHSQIITKTAINIFIWVVVHMGTTRFYKSLFNTFVFFYAQTLVIFCVIPYVLGSYFSFNCISAYSVAHLIWRPCKYYSVLHRFCLLGCAVTLSKYIVDCICLLQKFVFHPFPQFLAKEQFS